MDFLGLENTSFRNTKRGFRIPGVRIDCLILFLLICRFLLLSMNRPHPCMEPRPQLWIFDHEMGGRVHECMQLYMDKPGIYVKGPSIHGSRG